MMKKYFSIHWKLILIYFIVSVFYAIILASTGFVYSMLTNAALGKNFEKFIGVAIFSICFLLLDSYFDFVPRYVRSKLINHILDSLRGDLVTSYLNEDLQNIMKQNPADRTNKLVNSLEVIENGYLKPLLSGVVSVFVFVFSLAGAFYLQGTLAFIMLGLCFLPFLAPVVNKKILSDRKKEAQDQKKIYLSKFEDFSRNIASIRLMNAAKIFSDILKKRSSSSAAAAIRFEKAQSKTYAVSYGLSNIVYSGTWIIGGIFVFKNLLTVPELIAMTTLMNTVAGPIQTVSGLTTEFMSSRKVVDEFLGFLVVDNLHTAEQKIPFDEEIDCVELQNIHYEVDNQVLFNGLSFDFKKGMKYAIRGESGVGKSTLLQMVMGIIFPDVGRVIINHRELSEFEIDSYFQHFTYVPQKTAVFNGTIAQNVSMFKKGDESRIINSLKRAGLNEWLNRQENGIHTVLSTDNPLSGGEEHRLDIARSLYRETEMIILDEPTSGLDQNNELLISSVIQSLSDKLIIVVTHSNNKTFLDSFDYLLKLENQQLKIVEKSEEA